jgi:hypothetical protein
MRKGIRVFAVASLVVVLSSGGAAFAGSRDSQEVSYFARFLSWVLYSRLSPPTGTPTTNSRLSPPTGTPTTNSRLSPPTGSPAPAPEPESRLSPPTGLTDPPPTTT